MEYVELSPLPTYLNCIVALHRHELEELLFLLHFLIDVLTQLLHALCKLLLDQLPVIQLRLLLELLLLGEQSQIGEPLNQMLDLIALLADQLGSLIVALLEINILRVETLEVLAIAGQHRLIILPEPLQLGLATARDLFQSQLHLEMFEGQLVSDRSRALCASQATSLNCQLALAAGGYKATEACVMASNRA